VLFGHLGSGIVALIATALLTVSDGRSCSPALLLVVIALITAGPGPLTPPDVAGARRGRRPAFRLTCLPGKSLLAFPVGKSTGGSGNVDPRHAQASLDEVRTREQQIAEVVARDGSPWWYVGGIAAAFMAVAVSSDLDDLWGTGWIGTIFDYGVPAVGLAGIGALAMALHRSMRVRPRHHSAEVRRGTIWLATAFLVVFIGLGTALRAAGVSWDSTISGVAATLVFIGGSLILRRAAPAESTPRRPRVD
jgi:hypothetical protein